MTAFKKQSVVALTLIFFITSLTPSAYGAVSNAERRDKLSLHLKSIHDRARTARIVGGITTIGIGAGLGVGAIIASGSNDPEMRSTGTLLFGISGGALAAIGTLVLLLPNEYETLPAEYLALPDGNAEQVKRKVLVGEDTLQRLGDRARNERLVSAGTLVAVGVGQAVWYLADSSSNKSELLLYNAALFTGLGTLSFFTRRPAEEEATNYENWVARQQKVTLDWGITPLPGGAAVLAGVRF